MDYVAAHANDPPPSYGLSGPSELRPYTPSWAERVQGSAQDFASEKLGMSRYGSQDFGDKVRTAAEWLPGSSNAISANNSARSFSSGHLVIGSIQAVGAVVGLGIGGVVKKLAVRGAEKVGQTLAEREAVRLAEQTAAGALAKGVRITRNGYEYAKDALGRTTRAKGELKLNKAARDKEIQGAAGGADRLGTDQGGHLIGSRFDGPSDAINTVAQNQNLNQGAWKSMENSWANALADGKQVLVDVQPNYVGSSLRPDSFNVNYWINGDKFSQQFSNAAGQIFGR